MEVHNTDKAFKLPIPQDAWMIFQTDQQEIIRLNLGPGEAMDAHENPWNIVFFLLAGEGILRVEEKTFHLHKGDFISVDAELKRSWENPGQVPTELLVIKSKAAP